MAQNAFNQGYAPLALSRSLTVVTPRRETERPVASARAEVGFVAQLLAVRLDVPQYRVKRRESASAAAHAYSAGVRAGSNLLNRAA